MPGGRTTISMPPAASPSASSERWSEAEPPAKSSRQNSSNFSPMALEGGVELLLDLGVERGDQLLGRLDRAAQVGILAAHLLEPRGHLPMLLDGEWVDRADLGEGPSDASHLLFQCAVVQRLDLVARRLRGRLREPVQRQLALPRQGGQRLVPTRGLDGRGLCLALQLPEPRSSPALVSLQLEQLGPSGGPLGLGSLLGRRTPRHPHRVPRPPPSRGPRAPRPAVRHLARRSGSPALSCATRASRTDRC